MKENSMPTRGILGEQHNEAHVAHRRRDYRPWLVPVSIFLGIFAWWLATRLGGLPPFILPSPGLVLQRFVQALHDGSLLGNLFVTTQEVLAGMAIGVFTATALGYLLAKSPVVERLLSPYVVASQAIPIVAIAPLLVIWFGSGITSKILITALIVFFPVLINTIVGLRSVPEDLRDLMRSLLANSWQTFSKLEVPAALPVFLGGVKIGVTLSVIGAVVGEFVGADRGLGFMINQARGQYDTAMVFVAVLTLVVLALGLYWIVVLFEKRLLSWQQRSEE